MTERRMHWLNLLESGDKRPREAPENKADDLNAPLVQDAEERLAFEPVKVQTISEPVEKIICSTVVLSSVQPTAILLPRDPEREAADILAVDNAVVIAATQAQAGAAQNTVTDTPQPSGAWIPVGTRYTIRATGVVWAGITTTATNSRVSVVVYKR